MNTDIDMHDVSLNQDIINNFESLIDLAINSGNIIYIKQAIDKYKNLIDNRYIIQANNLLIELTEEHFDEMII